MIVCQCKGVTDADIRRAIREGAVTVEQVGLSCRAGTDCGGCKPTIQCLLQAELAPLRARVIRDSVFTPAH